MNSEDSRHPSPNRVKALAKAEAEVDPVAGSPTAKQRRLLRLSESNRVLEVLRVLSVWLALAVGVSIVTGDAAYLGNYWEKIWAKFSLALPQWSDDMLEVEVPDSAVEMLQEERLVHELYPLPAPVLDLEYKISGPSGISGRLQRRLWVGGRAEEKWEVDIVEDLEHKRSLEGMVLRNDRWLMTRWDGSRLLIRPSMSGKLRRAFSELNSTQQRKVIDGIHHWRTKIAELRIEERRADSRVPVRKILDQPCVELKLSAYTVCLWEQARVPLRVQGSQFTFEVVSIRPLSHAGPLVHLSKAEQRQVARMKRRYERLVEKNEHRDPQKRIKDQRAPKTFAMVTRFRFDPNKVLEEVADGNYSDLAQLLASENGLFGAVLPGHDFDKGHGEEDLPSSSDNPRP